MINLQIEIMLERCHPIRCHFLVHPQNKSFISVLTADKSAISNVPNQVARLKTGLPV